MRIYQLAVTTSSQVDQNCHMGDIFAQLYDWGICNKLNQLVTSVIDALVKRFKVAVPYNGVTQKLYFLDFF